MNIQKTMSGESDQEHLGSPSCRHVEGDVSGAENTKDGEFLKASFLMIFLNQSSY